jgi:hypothetical protein
MRRARRILGAALAVTVCGLTALVALGAHPASGQEPAAARAPEPGDVATAIADAGWYADGEAVGDREQLADVAERLSRQGEPMGFALLAGEPPGSSTVYAERVLDALIGEGERRIRTVVVLSDADVGVVSDVWSDAAIDRALDETIGDLRADPIDGLEALADALASEPAGFDEVDEGTDTDSSGLPVGLIVLGVVVLGGFALARWAMSGTAGDGTFDGDTGDDSWQRRSRWRRSSSFYRSSSSRSRSRLSGGSRRRSSGGSRRSRGRGGRRL